MASSLPRRSCALTWFQSELPHLLDRLHGALLGRMEHDGGGAHNAQDAPQDAQHVQLLVQKHVRKDGAAGSGDK